MLVTKWFRISALSCALITGLSAYEVLAQDAAPPPQYAVQRAPATAETLQQLVAPIALYPDELVAQVLAAATYPTEIVEANRWLQQNSSLKDAQLADAVDKQPWDPSVKALTQFPSVLANMDKNLSWTSALGDAYFNQSQDVLNAVQVMRKRAQNAGTLKTTAQQTVTTKDQTIIIEPANPEVVYLPEYDPWVVYGPPLLAYPGYFGAGFFVGPIIWFDVGLPLGHFHRHFPWGWHSWGCDWHNRFIVFNHNRFISRSPTFFASMALFGAWSLGFAWILLAQPAGQKTFSSPDEASRALIRAVQSGNEEELLEIFGTDGKEIISSGDQVEDQKSRDTFAEKYQRMNRLVAEPDGTVRLYVGAENWPMPIPLVNRKNAWYFDTSAGKEEILFRRIGRNEIATIRVLQELVAAQKEYYAKIHDDPVKQYAQKFVSDEGKHNGLYWNASNRENESPIGPLVAYASSEGYAKKLSPFQGYYFRVLMEQGKHASGGAKNYIVNGKMTRGFAFLAYPAEYGNSGIMTFVINQDGTLYQKDLGRDTAKLAERLSQYDPDKTWSKVE